MSVELVADPTADAWDAAIVASPGRSTMFQTFELGQIKRQNRWQPRYARVGESAVTIHEKHCPGFGRYWYLPKGPIVDGADQLEEVMRALAAAAKDEGAFVITIEPELEETDELAERLRNAGLIRRNRIQANESTILVDLDKPLDEVWSSIPSKRRSTIRKAERLGVEAGLVEPTEENLRAMWSLLQAVVDDHEIATRDADYYIDFWRTFIDAGQAGLFLARYEDRPIAGAFNTIIGEQSCYKDGGSVRERPVNGAAQFLQWKVIEWAHAQGATSHDLCTTPHSSQMDNTDDPFYGLGQFKKSFAKEVTDWIGAWDLPIRPLRHSAWNRVGVPMYQRLIARGGDGFF